MLIVGLNRLGKIKRVPNDSVPSNHIKLKKKLNKFDVDKLKVCVILWDTFAKLMSVYYCHSC